jgi:hypothetical protein
MGPSTSSRNNRRSKHLPFHPAPLSIKLEQSCKPPTLLPITAERFHAQPKAEFQDIWLLFEFKLRIGYLPDLVRGHVHP